MYSVPCQLSEEGGELSFKDPVKAEKLFPGYVTGGYMYICDIYDLM